MGGPTSISCVSPVILENNEIANNLMILARLNVQEDSRLLAGIYNAHDWGSHPSISEVCFYAPQTLIKNTQHVDGTAMRSEHISQWLGVRPLYKRRFS